MNFERRNSSGPWLLAALLTLLVPALPGMAQDAEELAEQQRQVMRQYMEAAGMSEEEMAQAESMIEQSMNPIVEQQAAQEAREQAEYEAQTAGLGMARVSILDRDIEMRITQCRRQDNGDFVVEAREAAGRRKGQLTLRGDGHYDRTTVQLISPGVGLYEAYISPFQDLDDDRFSWSGMAEGDRGPAELTVDVNCAGGG